MIRINLRPDVIISDDESPQDGVVDSEIQRKGLVHILLILVCPVALFVYGGQARPQKIREMQAISAQIAELTSFNEKQSAIVAEIEKILKDEKDVEKKIEAISNITQGRLVEIKVLDLLQTIVRDKMWFKSIEVDNSTISIDGMAQTEIDISIFLDDLNKNILLRDPRLVESQQEMYEGQNFSRFRIDAILEKSK